MEKQEGVYERVLIAIALLLCAAMIGYNAFYLPPEQDVPVMVYVDGSMHANEENAEADGENAGEEYTPELPPASSKVNLNSADEEELDTLPGVGSVLAQKIVAYRSEHGGFQNAEELMEVNGIGQTVFERLEPYITLEPEG